MSRYIRADGHARGATRECNIGFNLCLSRRCGFIHQLPVEVYGMNFLQAFCLE